jgi:hypothetical protein
MRAVSSAMCTLSTHRLLEWENFIGEERSLSHPLEQYFQDPGNNASIQVCVLTSTWITQCGDAAHILCFGLQAPRSTSFTVEY